MKDYINVLLETLEERDREYLGWEYFVQSERAMEAMETLEKTFSREQRELFRDYEYFVQSERAMAATETLEKTFSREQRELFRDYEDKQSTLDNTGRMALARRAFLLAKEIYR